MNSYEGVTVPPLYTAMLKMRIEQAELEPHVSRDYMAELREQGVLVASQPYPDDKLMTPGDFRKAEEQS